MTEIPEYHERTRNDAWKILVIHCYETLLIALPLRNLFEFCLFSSDVFEENKIDGCERAAGSGSEMEMNDLSHSEEALCLLDSGNISKRG